MRKLFHIYILLLLINLIVCCIEISAQAPSAISLDLDVRFVPKPVKVNGKAFLVYELNVTSFSKEDLKITRFDVIVDDRTQPFLTYSGSELENNIVQYRLTKNVADKRIIEFGSRIMIPVQVVCDLSYIPKSIYHRLTIEGTSPTNNENEVIKGKVEGARIQVSHTTPIVIAPPIQGSGWVAHNGFFQEHNHRESVQVVNGKAHMPERFAIDWLKLGENGKIFHDDATKNENWYCYGQDVLAVRQGTVISIMDGLPDNIPGKGAAISINLDTLGGNYIFLDIGSGHYAYYAHLKSGSIKVKVGQRVRQGQVLAKIGNSGNSDSSHLHFHIVNKNSPFGAEGIPYIFKSFEVQETLKSIMQVVKGVGWKKNVNSLSDNRQFEHPADKTIINFPNSSMQ